MTAIGHVFSMAGHIMMSSPVQMLRRIVSSPAIANKIVSVSCSFQINYHFFLILKEPKASVSSQINLIMPPSFTVSISIVN